MSIRSPAGARQDTADSFITQQVQALYCDREEHGEIDIPFRNVNVETFQNQGKANRDQKGERQHFTDG